MFGDGILKSTDGGVHWGDGPVSGDYFQGVSVSRLVVTAHNAPCHDFLPQSGFARDGDTFVFSGTDGAADPPSLAIEAVPAPAA